MIPYSSGGYYYPSYYPYYGGYYGPSVAGIAAVGIMAGITGAIMAGITGAAPTILTGTTDRAVICPSPV